MNKQATNQKKKTKPTNKNAGGAWFPVDLSASQQLTPIVAFLLGKRGTS